MEVIDKSKTDEIILMRTYFSTGETLLETSKFRLLHGERSGRANIYVPVFNIFVVLFS
jgi:hypothetical protein